MRRWQPLIYTRYIIFMFLEKPFDKAQSSTSLLQFILLDFEHIRQTYPFQELVEKTNNDPDFKSYISRNKTDYNQKFNEIIIAVVSQHIEILRESLREHLDNLKISSEHIVYKLGFFISDLRHAFSHTKGRLIPKFDKAVKTKQPLLIHIPIKKHGEAHTEFCTSASDSFSINCTSIPNALININMEFIYTLYLLSFHILKIL